MRPDGPAAIAGSGMVTGLGFTAPASCAAIRAGLSGMQEQRFMFGGEWLVGCSIPVPSSWRGKKKLVELAAMAVSEALESWGAEVPVSRVPLLFCVPEADRPGCPDDLDGALSALQGRLGVKFAAASTLLATGRSGSVEPLSRARELLAAGAPACVVAGTDSLLVGPALESYHQRARLKTEENSDGFQPGEAAAAVVLAPPFGSTPDPDALFLHGVATALEPAPIDSGEPLRAEGLSRAIKGALADAGCTYASLDYRIADVNGEQYGLREAALALTRTLRERKEQFPLWHPASSIGEVGAARIPLILGVAAAAARKGYARGAGVLCHFSGDGRERGAAVLSIHRRLAA